MTSPEPARTRMPAPLRISLLYAAFGAAWILLGDFALWMQGGVSRTALLLELGKGALFVAASALLLYVLIRREVMQRQRAAAELESVLETAPVGIAAVAADGTIRDWNAAASRILGWSEVEVSGRPAAELGLAPGPHTDAGETYDIAVRAKDGASVDIRMFAGRPDPSSNGERVVAFLDRRPQVEIETALRQSHKLEAVGRLAGGIAHEFNNVLTIIIGHAALLIDGFEESDDRRGHVEEIRRSGERAASLTRQLLVFSGRHITRTASIDLARMLGDMEPAMMRAAGDRVHTEYDPADPLWPVQCDVAQLHQLVLNLVVNAREAMPDGGTLTIETANVQIARPRAADTAPGIDTVPPGEYVRLRITDTGRGMSGETLAHLFEPFFTTKEQGTGLGLATVYGIVQQCDGHIRVRSRPGRGARFDIYFPRASAIETGTTAHLPRDTSAATLLIVEDDDAVRDLTCRILRRSGHRVLSARNGHEALTVLRSGEDVRLIIADIVMPGMNGIELGEHVGREFPNLPILFTSGYVAPPIGDAAGLSDGSRFIEKPYRPDQLVARVSELLR